MAPDHTRRCGRLLALGLAGVLLVVVGFAGAARAQDAAVEVQDNAFVPGSITVAEGTTVTWTQAGGNPHSVTADDGSFDSHPVCPPVCMMNGNTFEVTFPEVGEFPYYCKIHGGPGGQGMSGVVLVQPPQPPPPPPPPPPPDEFADGGRVDGGGSQDPVAQAIATSQSLFADGGASRVVLATSERFPDALAGAALAGNQGPVLLTPFGDSLDPRVRDEIARVTGGDGVALVLGGTAAVTEPAAAEAQDAAGNADRGRCTGALPSTCRYAGTGREHTAALVAETVVTEHPGARALLARGDQFADAITGGAYAAEAGVPILLTPSNSLAEETREFFNANEEITQVVVLGGEAAIDQPTMDSVPVPERRRVFGPERTATAAAIATDLWSAEGRAPGGIVLVNVRSENGWQTALSAAVASAVHDAPQLGVETPPAAPSDATLDAAALIGGAVQAYGSTELVSPEQLDSVREAA